MYSEFLAKTDVAVYVLRADSRDYAVDERAFAKLFCSDETKDRVIIAVNCADKVEPINRSTPFSPTQAQLKNIDQKIGSVVNRRPGIMLSISSPTFSSYASNPL